MLKWTWNPNFREMKGRHLTLAKRRLKFQDNSTVQAKKSNLGNYSFSSM